MSVIIKQIILFLSFNPQIPQFLHNTTVQDFGGQKQGNNTP